MRKNDRQASDLRQISFETGFIDHHKGSVLTSFGGTRVLVVATYEDRVPPFRMGSGGGWLTAEYSMLPASTHDRKRRDISKGRPDGRSVEIQRLIGRSLRNVVDIDKLDAMTINIDCDVIQADGGTRTASITGAWVALMLLLKDLKKRGKLKARIDDVVTGQVAAVSLGVLGGEILTDLDYSEDSKADTDLNLIARKDGTIIEVQGTAEGAPMTRADLDNLVDQGLDAVQRLCALQTKVVEAAGD